MFVYVVQRDSRQDMAYESTPVISVCATERQALRYVIADIVSEHIQMINDSSSSSLLPSERQKIRAEQQREWDSLRHISRYWVSRWPVDDGPREDNVGNTDEIFGKLEALEYGSGRCECTLTVDIDKRIKETCARLHTDDQVVSFLSGLRKAHNVEMFLDTLHRERDVMGRDVVR